jgi:serine protease AprX
MHCITILFLAILLSISSISAEGLAKELIPIIGKDTLCKVWVRFKDKPSLQQCNISTRALARRAKVNFTQNELDLPVNTEYIARVEFYGAKLRRVYKWDNAASFLVHASLLPKIASLPIVNEVSLVGSFVRFEDQKTGALKKGSTLNDSSSYGYSFDQLNIVNIPAAHRYLTENREFSAPGEGVLIALFDTGFRLKHKSLQKVKQGKIKATYDFIDNDTSVADPDSVASDSNNPYYRNDLHGSTTLSLIAGFDPGNFMGAAWGAEFALARTENTYQDATGLETEIHSEEDDWAAAVVWAESLGVDIISSSLGYRDGFQDTASIAEGNGYRKVNDYQYSDLDGKTTIVSRAAIYAIQRGIIVVNAMGNEGADEPGTLCAPADVDGVISVGALDRTGSAIAYFSSTGPTSDGRIKPDLVAKGESVSIPAIYGDSSMYVSGNGTSYATPIIAGLCALIVQSMQDKNSNRVKTSLYASCKYLPEQFAQNNLFGRGIPDALKACTNALEVAPSGIDFSVYPNVLKPGIPRNISFAVLNSDNFTEAGLRIFSVDGLLVWKTNVVTKVTSPVIATWDCKSKSGKSVAPGVYLVVLEYNGCVYKRKILIAG